MFQTLSTDICVKDADLYLIPVQTRVPLKFGSETLLTVTCARARVTVEDRNGKTASGWGETPLSVQWVWPSELAYSERHTALVEFCKILRQAWIEFDEQAHPILLAHSFFENVLHPLQDKFNASRDAEPMPYLAGLVAASVFDQAIHDAYGVLHNLDIYETYNSQFLNSDLAAMLTPAEGSNVSFAGKFPNDFLVKSVPQQLPV